jgi:hypothetical protein
MQNPPHNDPGRPRRDFMPIPETIMRHASSGLPTPVARPPRLSNALLAAVLLAASTVHAATWGPFNAEFPAAADGLVK